MGQTSSHQAVVGSWTPSSQDTQRQNLGGMPENVFVALMGVTGSGKSTFISHCTNQEVQIGHNLQACKRENIISIAFTHFKTGTQEVKVYDCEFSPSITIKLVDTPGFDDTNQSDTHVHREIAAWLTASYSSEIQLRGIIYLHRITDIRMQGSARRNLLMFKKLCGPEALRNVILATTMWEQVNINEGAKREKELEKTPDLWGWMISKGSGVERHTNDRESALRLLSIFASPNSRMKNCAVDLQKQMIDQGKSLTETAAGMELEQELAKEREKFQKEVEKLKQEMKEAVRAQDAEVARELQRQKKKMDWEIQRVVEERARLQSSLQEEHNRSMAQLQAALEAAQVARQDAEAQQARNQQALNDTLKARSQQQEEHRRELELAWQKLEATQLQQSTPSGEKASNIFSSKGKCEDIRLATIAGESFYLFGKKTKVWW